MSSSNELNTNEEFQEEWLSAYLDGELTPQQKAVVESRLQYDSNAQLVFLDLQRVRRILGQLPAWPEVEPANSLVNRLSLSELPPPSSPAQEKEAEDTVSSSEGAGTDTTPSQAEDNLSSTTSTQPASEFPRPTYPSPSADLVAASSNLEQPEPQTQEQEDASEQSAEADQHEVAETATRETSSLSRPAPVANEFASSASSVEDDNADSTNADDISQTEDWEETEEAEEHLTEELEQDSASEGPSEPSGDELVSETDVEPEYGEDEEYLDEEELETASFDEPSDEQVVERVWNEDSRSGSALAWLRPVGIAASILLMSGIGWVLWNQSSSMKLATTESARAPASGAEPSKKATRGGDLTEPTRYAVPQDGIADSEMDSLPSLEALKTPDSAQPNSAPAPRMELPPELMDSANIGNDKKLQKAAEGFAGEMESDYGGGFGAKPNPAESQALQRGSARFAPSQQAPQEESPEPSFNVPASPTRSLHAAPFQMQQQQERSQPEASTELSFRATNLEQIDNSLRLVGVAYSDAWRTSDVESAVTDLVGTPSRQSRFSQLERIISSVPGGVFQGKAPTQQIAAKVGFLNDLSNYADPNWQDQLSEEKEDEAASKSSQPRRATILLFVSRSQAEDLLTQIQQAAAPTNKSYLGMTDVEQPSLYRRAVRVLAENSEQTPASPGDTVILQLNLQ